MAGPAFTIQEVGGQSIVLSGRALPYRPLKFQGTQQLEQTWYPGYDRATVQVLGPHEENTTINGMWKDRFLAENGVGVFGGVPSPRSAIVSAGQPIFSTIEAVTLFENLRRSGVQIDVSWGPVARRGYLRSFSHTWTTEHDCEWEMEFLWTSNESARMVTPPNEGRPRPILPQEIVGQLDRIPAQLEAIAIKPSWLDKVRTSVSNLRGRMLDSLSAYSAGLQDIQSTLRQMSGLIGSTVTESLALINQASSTGLDVLGVANSVGSTLGSFRSIDEVAAQQWSAILGGAGVTMATLNTGEPNPTSILLTTYNQSEAQRLGRAQIRLLQELQAQIDASLEPVPDTFYVTRDGDNLRGISTRFYGNPDRWTDLQAKNKELLDGYNDSSNVPAGLTLTIPGAQQNG
jgi:hypothetical protein